MAPAAGTVFGSTLVAGPAGAAQSRGPAAPAPGSFTLTRKGAGLYDFSALVRVAC